MKRTVLTAAVALAVASVVAAVRPGAPFADGAVLQRGRPVPVWGTAAPGELVTVSFAGQRKTATADASGNWRVNLDPLFACAKGRDLVLSASNRVVLHDILVGEVWFCSGQSNMECPVWSRQLPRFRDRFGALAMQFVDRPTIRFAQCSVYGWSTKPRKDLAVKWRALTKKNILDELPSYPVNFSAIGVYFALSVDDLLKDVPIGLVGAYWGGSAIDPWIPHEAYARHPVLKDVGETPLYEESETNKVDKNFRFHQQPSVQWNRMIAPWVPYASRGLLWYQGETNSGDGRYCEKMHALYDGWSTAFENPGFRLYFAQLAPYEGYPEAKMFSIQASQFKFAAEEPNAKIALTCDVGNISDIHPAQKETVGRRLALYALKYDYGFSDVNADWPHLRAAVRQGDAVLLAFDNAAAFTVWNEKIGDMTTGFELCGADGIWKPAELKNPIDRSKGHRSGSVGGRDLIVASSDVKDPVKVRYLYHRPYFASIVNEVGQPIPAFEESVKTFGRFGNVYFPGERAELDLGLPSSDWRILDADDAEVASGKSDGRWLALPHEAIGRRFGAFVACAASGAQTNRVRFAFLSSKTVKPAPWVGTGLHSLRWYQGDSAFLDLVASAGIGVVRDCVQWDCMEKKKGDYRTLPEMDRLLDRLNELGIRMNWILFRANPIYENPLDPKAFAAFCGWLADRYKGKVNTYEIWNEPHNFDFFSRYQPVYGYGNNRRDRRWMKHFVELTHAADDELAKRLGLTVGVGAEDWWELLGYMLDMGLACPHNVVTIHPYDHEQPIPEKAPFFCDGFKSLRERMKANGGAARIAITEVGWTTYDASAGAEHAYVGNYPAVTFAEQAQYLVRMYLLARQSGVEYTCQYDFRDDGTKRYYTEHNFGLVDYWSNPKPSYAAVAFMTRILQNARPTGVESGDSDAYRICRFVRGGKSVSAAWSVQEPREVGFSDKVVAAFDLFGNKIANPVSSGRLQLTGRPVYLVTEGCGTRVRND